MLVYARHTTPRLQYVLNFLAGEIGGGKWSITTDPLVFENSHDARINYSNKSHTCECVNIKPFELLFETGLKPQQIQCGEQEGKKFFFQNDSDTGFDIFAAVFYLLSRYEEYLPHTKDQFGRYAYQNAIAHRQEFLTKPLVNIWLQDLQAILKKKFPSFQTKPNQFTFLPSYDVDMAWSFRHKGFYRTAGNLLKDLAFFRYKNFFRRIRVIRGREKDPFQNFDWLNTLHEKHRIRPFYFFIVAEKVSGKDKNNSPHLPEMKALIRKHAVLYPVGLHPSWQSNSYPQVLKREKTILENITGTEITSSRQHYIKMEIPTTYRHLLKAGIRSDYSMGYPGINGFRASVASPFNWYDLEAEAETNLTVFPFCFMDVNAMVFQKQTPQEAYADIMKLYNEVRSVNGFFSMIWHNISLSEEPEFIEWRKMYEALIDATV